MPDGSYARPERRSRQKRRPREEDRVVHPRAQFSAVNQPYDPIFFRKIDIKVGTYLEHAGRLNSGTRWKVTRVLTDLGLGRGVKSVPEVQKLNDTVRLRIVETNRGDNHGVFERAATFGYLSYSAIWRLAQDQTEAAAGDQT